MKQRTTPIGDVLKSARAAIEQADSARVKKTALQEAFSLLQELHPSLFNVHTEAGRTFVNTFHQFLDIEKKQIMDAYNEGNAEWTAIAYTDAKHYYNSIYRNL